MRDRFGDALEAYVRTVREDSRIEGLLVSGSYVTGRMGPYSDLDVFLLVGDDTEYSPKWETRVIDAVEFEIGAHTAAEYEEVIDGRSAVRQVIHPLAVGEVVFDLHGRMAALKARAGAVVEELSARVEPSAEMMKDLARPLEYGFRKVGNAYSRGEWDVFRYEYGFVLHLVPMQVLRLRGYQLCVRPLDMLERELPDLWALFHRCLEANTPEEKWVGLCELMRGVYGEFGLGEVPRGILDCGLRIPDLP